MDSVDHMNGDCGANCHIILFVYNSREHGIQTPFVCASEELLRDRARLQVELRLAYHQSARSLIQAADNARVRVDIQVRDPYELWRYVTSILNETSKIAQVLIAGSVELRDDTIRRLGSPGSNIQSRQCWTPLQTMLGLGSFLIGLV
jgi:hypothetical protein